MKKKESKYLIHKLPDYSPSDKVWNNIEEQLNRFNKNINIQKNLHKLPQYNAPEKTWDQIQNQLANHNKFRIQNYMVRIAAIFILLIGISVILKPYIIKNFENYTISYATEFVSESDDLNSNIIQTDHNMLLAEQCENYPKICNDEDFIELKNLLNKLVIEEIALNQKFEKYKDPEINNCLIKIQNDKAKIEKYMLAMFTN